jgi:hypothetical protein
MKEACHFDALLWNEMEKQGREISQCLPEQDFG